jgi:PAS domain S-box-containing protein
MNASDDLAANPLTDLLLAEPGVGRCLVGADGRIERVNDAWCRSTGFAAADVIGVDILDLFPETRDMGAAMHAHARAGHPVLVPRHAQRVNGETRWWEGRIDPIPTAAGTALLITARECPAPPDETAAKALRRAEQAREEAHARLQTVLDSISDGLLMLDHDWRYTYVSRRAAEIIGMQPEDLLGRCVWDLFPYAVGTKFHEGYLRAMATGEKVSFEEHYPPLDLWLECHCYPGPEGLTVYFQDLSDRRRAQASLRRSTALLRAISDASSDVIYAKDRDGRMIFANPAALALIGRGGEEQVAGHTDAELLEDPEAAAQVMANDRRVMESGVAAEFEERVPLPDGTERIWLSRKTPYRDEDGRVVGLLGISRDVTERTRAVASLRESDRRKSEFLAVLSHELRNPLAPISNSVQLLLRVEPGSSAAQRALGVIERQTAQLARLVDDLLDLTRISLGKVELQRAPLDLRELVRRGVEDLRSVAARGGVTLRGDAGGEPLWTVGDATRLAQALGNLVHNAVKFTPPGGFVDVRLRRDGAQARLAVRDTGEGLDPARIESMFEPFVQAEQTLARPQGGLGLGLALVKGFVEMHGGRVEARSEGPGRGAEFVLRLPLSDPPLRPGAGDDGAPAEAPRRVLVVEDNADAAQTLADLLQILGHEVRVAGDVRSGLALAATMRPDIVMCDLGLPDRPGHELARALRADPAFAATRLVALSGYAQPEDRQQAREAGFDEHLAKPPDIDRLLALFERRG